MRILAESLEPGAKVAEVARRHDVAASLLFSWRRQVRLPEGVPQPIVPVVIAEPVLTPPAPAKACKGRGTGKERGLIEIDLGSGRRVRVDARVDADALARVLDVLSR